MKLKMCWKNHIISRVWVITNAHNSKTRYDFFQHIFSFSTLRIVYVKMAASMWRVCLCISLVGNHPSLPVFSLPFISLPLFLILANTILGHFVPVIFVTNLFVPDQFACGHFSFQFFSRSCSFWSRFFPSWSIRSRLFHFPFFSLSVFFSKFHQIWKNSRRLVLMEVVG